MPTPEPPADPLNPLIQAIRDQFESRVYPDEGIEASDLDVMREYNRWFKLPYVRQLIRSVLSGAWGLGSTQEEVAESLGMDRSRLSDALRHGELSLDVYIRLRSCPTRPPDWEPEINALRAEMDRSGCIGVARYFATQVSDRPGLSPDQLNELNFELLCEMLRQMRSWFIATQERDTAFASTLFRTVVADRTRNVLPSWYTNAERRRIETLIGHIESGPAAAFEHLHNLQTHWMDILIVTYFQLEIIHWRDA